jgi:DNA-directed RNA polymerase specialized sigma24 family protein
MSLNGSVTQWIGQLKNGEQAAIQRLWEAYFRRLVGLARDRLRGVRQRTADEEDVALSAFDSFCRGVERGRFPRLDDCKDLWRLLAVITVRKAFDLARHERSLKHGGGKVRGESAFDGPDDEPGIEQVLGREPSPEFAALMEEAYRGRLARLPDETFRSVAQWKLEGYTNAEIATQLDCDSRTVERKLGIIRSLWGKDDAP